MLSHRLPVFGLVGFYPTNYLIGRKPLLKRNPTNREPFLPSNMLMGNVRGIRPDFSIRRVPLLEGLATYQVVGGVMAYKAIDG